MNLLQKAADFVVRLLRIDSPAGWPGSADTDAGESVNECSVLGISAAWACVNLLAGTIASLPLMVYRTDRNGDRQVARDHPLYRILHDSPNADQTAVDFWEFGNVAIEVRGNFHARKERIGQRLVGLTPIHAVVDPRRAEDGSIRYRFTEDGRFYDLSQDEVFHVRGFGGTPLAGLSTLSYGREAFGLAIATRRSAASTFKNGMRPSVQLAFEKFLTPDQRKTAEDGIAAKYSSAVNHGRPFIAEGGAELKPISITPEDAQMLGLMGHNIEEVCRFFGVPPFMIGHTEKTTSWGTGLEQQVLGFQKFSLRRRLKRIEQAIEKQLLSPQDRAQGITVEFNLEGLLRGDSKSRSEFYNAGLQNGWFTINEVRALENMPPVEGGEVPRMQMQNVPITEAGQVQAVRPALPAPTPALPAPEEAA